jgi:pimeloyl-ACP methyl ester carboxylesterase
MRSIPIAAVLLVLAAAAPASALDLAPCKGQKGFSCGVLVQPLDHAHPEAAKVHLRFAVQRGKRPLLIALSGGPGQPSVAYASSFTYSLAPALRRYRLAVFDQRGTGKSGVLNCPKLQKSGSLADIRPEDLAACAERIGPRRAFYSTADTVEDIEALRVALGASKVALMGISYGTFVAEQYARVHPATTSSLILDSVVGADGPDPFYMDSYSATPRVLNEQCAARRCRGVTSDPVGDVAAVLGKLPVRGRTFDPRGRARTTRYTRPDEIVNLLTSADLNPFLQAMLPGAVNAAVRGDPAELLRVRKAGDGGPTKLADLSFGLNVTTACEDTALPYALTTPFAQRDSATAAALAAIPAESYRPFTADAVLNTSPAQDCSRWPQDVVNTPSYDPLPDVPVLLLSGRLDLRTPMENAAQLAEELPQATRVRVAGTGHDVLDQDITGCAATVLSRFVRGRKVGTPCRGKSNAVAVLPRPPRSLAAFRAAPGVGGLRGRALFAALDSVADARTMMFINYYAGLSTRGGGLRGGSFAATDTSLRLRRYAYMPGLRLSGRLRLGDAGELSGRVRVDGPRGASGSLRLYADGGAAGRLGGRAVSYKRKRASAARMRAAPPLTAALARVPFRLLLRARAADRRDYGGPRHP